MSLLDYLTNREIQTLSYLCKGFLNKEICIEMSIARVKKNDKQIFKKLDVRNRTEGISNKNLF